MERIKATQQKNRGRKFKEPNSHNVGKTTWVSGNITAVIILLQQNMMIEIKLLLYITAPRNRFYCYL
jgi:hypothetical protein